MRKRCRVFSVRCNMSRFSGTLGATAELAHFCLVGGFLGGHAATIKSQQQCRTQGSPIGVNGGITMPKHRIHFGNSRPNNSKPGNNKQRHADHFSKRRSNNDRGIKKETRIDLVWKVCSDTSIALQCSDTSIVLQCSDTSIALQCCLQSTSPLCRQLWRVTDVSVICVVVFLSRGVRHLAPPRRLL